MDLVEMSDVLKKSLGLTGEPVGIALFKDQKDIPPGLKMIEKPISYCRMVMDARGIGAVSLAGPQQHDCKGGASGIGLVQIPENIASGSLYFNKLNKCSSIEIGKSIVAAMPRLQPGSTAATLVSPLAKMPTNPDIVILVGSPLVARRIAQTVMYNKGGRLNIDTAGIQSFCVDATASPYLKGNVNASLGCDGSAKKSGLTDQDVVVGIPFGMMEDICKVLKERHEGWDKFMRG
jgi:uncharacterized protein (DUF169 family)